MTAASPPRRLQRPAGLALTVLVHLLLLAGWQLGRHAPPAAGGREPAQTRIQWIRMAAPAVAPPVPRPERVRRPAVPASTRAASHPLAAPAAPVSASPVPAADGMPQDRARAEEAPAAPAAPSARDILQRARREAGAIDRALRKENTPYIVAPLDSPTIRMRDKMAAAHDAVTPGAGAAPGVEELGNESGAPLTRIRGSLGTYCLTARSPGAGIDAFERGGGIRRTACPPESSQGGRKGWRTARD